VAHLDRDPRSAWEHQTPHSCTELDGFRGQLLLNRGQVRSRTGKPMTWLPELTTLGQALPHRRLILDGVIRPGECLNARRAATRRF
jgi:hypothetical protein